MTSNEAKMILFESLLHSKNTRVDFFINKQKEWRYGFQNQKVKVQMLKSRTNEGLGSKQPKDWRSGF